LFRRGIMARNLSRTHALAVKLLFAAFQVLKEKGGELPGREVFEEVERRVELDEWASGQLAKSGYVRWESVLHFYSIDAVKAGFLLKKNGVWYLTREGERALSLGDVGLLDAAIAAYREWHTNLEDTPEPEAEEAKQYTDKGAMVTLQRIEEIALEGITKYISSKDGYEFQDLVAALLRGMGYYTRVSPRGRDGGVDVVAYRDPLGTESPRIKVQVKHREQQATVQQVRELMGVLQRDGDAGIFVSTGGFTPDAKAAVLGSHVHIELVDLPRFIELWRDFYHKLTDEDRNRLPLIPVYFLEPTD
jgi:restriction system protein